MDTQPLCFSPDTISQISFHISNHNGFSFQILLNCTRRTKRIRITIAGKDCLTPRHALTPEACDDLQIYSAEFPISPTAFTKLIARLDEIGICSWKKRYFADSYPPVQWNLTITRAGGESVSSSGTSAYPQEWESFISIWNMFARLDQLLLLSRRRICADAD